MLPLARPQIGRRGPAGKHCRTRTLGANHERPSPALLRDPQTRRALQLDALAAILPMDRRDRLAEILTDDDVATLRHLAREGMGENSLRALASDLAYLEAWAQAATRNPLPWPAPEELALKFVAHHLWDPARRESDPAHGMPAEVAAALRAAGLCAADGPHAPSTVKRRLSSWSDLASLARRGRALRLPVAARRAAPCGPRQRAAAPARAEAPSRATSSIGCWPPALPIGSPIAATGRCCWSRSARRAPAQRNRGLRVEQLTRSAGRLDPADPSLAAPALHGDPPWPDQNHRGRRRRQGPSRRAARSRRCAYGSIAADIAKGPVFRAIDQWGGLDDKALTPQAVNLILKRRIAPSRARPQSFPRMACAPAI